MTIDQIREHLPSLPVTFQGHIWQGQVLGRTAPFARVALVDECGVVTGVSFEAEWVEILRALENNQPLIA